MKVLAMSDMHGKLPAPEDLEPVDLIAIAGDISPISIEKNVPAMIEWLVNDFIPWVNNLAASNVILVAGNHDFIFQNPKYRNDAIWTVEHGTLKCKYLQDEFVEIDGNIIYGSPWVVSPKGFAFVDPKLNEIKKTMPERADLVILHQPLQSCENGTVLDPYEFSHPSYGSDLLDEIVAERGPKHIVTGHVHTGNHEMSSIPTAKGTCLLWNVSLLDESYHLAYEPLIIRI